MRGHKLLLAVVAGAVVVAAAQKKPGYRYQREGNRSDRAGSARAGLVLLGGGTDLDAAFQWMC
ncbi:MAG: hypothetical protein ACRD1F_09415, partial [Terriglobales bacterium]